MPLSDSQFITIIGIIIASTISIIGIGIGLAYRIGKKSGEITKSIASLKEQVDKVEDDLKYMFRLNLEESRKEAGEVRRDLRLRSTKGQEEQKKG